MLKLGTQTGSFVNWMMSQGQTPPVVGKGATVLLWTDRHAYFVDYVSKDGKEIAIERPDCKRVDDLRMSDSQEYTYGRNANANKITLRFKYGKWRDKQTGQVYNIKFGYMDEYYDFSF